MLKQILKKDMLKRKGVNTILFLFITLATIFLASSINNIMIVSSAVDYYVDYAKVPDVNIILDRETEYQTLTVHIKMLRSKIESNGSSEKRIHTVWGVGYRYEEV